MSTSSPPPRWQQLPASPLIDALNEDEEIEDIVALSGAEAPTWLRQLSIPEGWQLVEPPGRSDPPLTRLAVCGPLGNGEWEAAETVSVFGYTGWPVFYDVLHNADRALRGLKAAGIAVKVLPVPPIQWTAALRSSGIAVVRDRRVWIQQSNYVAGSEQPHAGRLIVHSIFVDAASRTRLAEDITQLSNAVYQGFINALSGEHPAN